jgi:signal transduction histidine kinase
VTAARSERDRLAGRVLDRLPAGVLAIDDAGRIAYTNRSARELLDNDAAATRCEGQPIGDWFRCDPPLPLASRDLEQPERRFTTTLRTVDDRTVGLGLSVTSLPGDAAIERLLIFREIPDTNAQMVEAILGSSSGALASLAGEFIHRLRNPLTAIRGLADLLALESAPDSPTSEYAARLLGAADRIERFIRDFARLSGIEPPRREHISVRELARIAIASIRDRDQRAGQIVVQEENLDRTLHCDREQFSQALSELLLNALESGSPAAEVSVRAALGSATPPGRTSRIGIEVADRGTGVAAADIRRTFEPFYSTKAERSGLGLSIAYGYVHHHGGSLELTRREGGGTLARIDLAEVAS